MDIAAHKLAETALKGSEAGYLTLVEGSLQGIVILDAEDRIAFANTVLANIFGYEHVQALVGQKLRDRVAPQDFARIHRYLQSRYRGESIPPRCEIQGVKHDGTLCWLETLYVPFDWEGEVVRMSTVIDISERKALQRELVNLSEYEHCRLGQELHDGLGQLFAGIALESRMLADDLAQQDHAAASAAARVADWVYQALGTIHEVAHGLYPEVLTSRGLGQALQSLAAQTERLFGLSCRVEGEIPERLMASCAVLNLYRIAQEAMTNAVKHGQATTITLLAEVMPGYLRLRISDNGVGIPDHLARGMGMGLRNMQTRAATLGATLEIKRLAEGGTEIVCTVPLDQNGRG